MPGYKSKNTSIWLNEGPMTLDFVLEPEVSVKGSVLQNVYDCNCDSKCKGEFVQFLWGSHLEVYLVLVVVLGFLCLLFQRRIKVKFSTRQSTGPKRTVVVWGFEKLFVLNCVILRWVKKKNQTFFFLSTQRFLQMANDNSYCWLPLFKEIKIIFL